jgi:protein-S-isoprenylcysteine O-methyltransferase Ste14
MVFFLYGLVCYALFVLTLLYAVGFVEGMGVPKSINSGPAGPVGLSIAVNLALLGLFAVQHSVMARRWFKRQWTRVVPAAIERSTFVLATCAVFALLFWQWRPLPQVIWSVDNTAARAVILAVSLLGFGLGLYASFLIDHFDLFGLRQVWRHMHRLPHEHPTFKTPWLYRLVRNPLMLGFLIAFWAAPDLTLGRLLFNVATTGYILLGVTLEERDLGKALGEQYSAYRRSTPMLLPRPSLPRAAATDKPGVAGAS